MIGRTSLLISTQLDYAKALTLNWSDCGKLHKLYLGLPSMSICNLHMVLAKIST